MVSILANNIVPINSVKNFCFSNSGTGLKSENAVNKIIEFSKKVRELTADLEKEKTKNAALQRKFDDNVMVSNF